MVDRRVTIVDESGASRERRTPPMQDIHAPAMKPSLRADVAASRVRIPILSGGQTGAQIPSKAVVDEKPVVTSNGVPPLTKDSSVEDGEDDPLVDQITIADSNEVLAAEDANIAKAFDGHKSSLKERLRNLVQAWWGNKWARYGTIAGVAVLLITAAVLPVSRYFILNLVGVRAATSLTVSDQSTELALKNVSVTVGNQTIKTDQNGTAKLEHLKLGSQQLKITQLGFATVSRSVTLGLGSNPLGEVSLKAVGLQFQFKLTDFLSGKPLQKAAATSGDASALSDSKGIALLTVGPVDDTKMTVTVAASGYRTEKVSLDTATTTVTSLAMVPSRKDVFVSKQTGKYDVYTMDLDGKNRKILLAATGLENDKISLVQHPTDEEVALVSTRENKHNQDGYLLETLTLVDIDTADTLSLDSSERIQIVDWVGDKLIYVRVKAGTSAGNAERYQLMSYDYKTATRLQLGSANYFSDIVSAKGKIYYAASNNYKDGQDQFVAINPDNTGKVVIQNADIWNILRTGYNDMYLSGQDGWYSYHLGDTTAKKLAAAPANVNDTRFYLDAPDGKHALWTESRDGKGVLLSYDAGTSKDTTLNTQSGLNYPLRWLNSRTVIYRVTTPQETADYAMSLDGGTAHKLTDVTATTGFGPWYSY